MHNIFSDIIKYFRCTSAHTVANRTRSKLTLQNIWLSMLTGEICMLFFRIHSDSFLIISLLSFTVSEKKKILQIDSRFNTMCSTSAWCIVLNSAPYFYCLMCSVEFGTDISISLVETNPKFICMKLALQKHMRIPHSPIFFWSLFSSQLLQKQFYGRLGRLECMEKWSSCSNISTYNGSCGTWYFGSNFRDTTTNRL